MRDVTNMWRSFAVNDESGAIICSYPDGAYTPAIPIPYCEETMTGFEYSLAGLLIANGYVDEGERVVKAVRDRYDGEKRNPWNEIECGSNYARSMASFALMPIYSGFSFDMTKKYIGFAPLSGGGSYLWSVGNTWGTVSLCENACTLSVLGEPLELSAIGLASTAVTSVKADGRDISFALENGKISFETLTVVNELVIM